MLTIYYEQEFDTIKLEQIYFGFVRAHLVHIHVCIGMSLNAFQIGHYRSI